MSYILISIFACWFVLSGIPEYVKSVLFNFGISKSGGVDYLGNELFVPIRLLPFDCEKCLAFWSVFIYGAFHEHLWLAVIYGGCASLFAMVLTMLINRIR